MALDIFKITGPVRLDGTVTISGSKNAALPIIASAILAPGKTILNGVPNLSDIEVMCRLVESLGCKTEAVGGKIVIDSTVIDKPFGDYEIVRKMRAGVCVLGPLLARCGKAEVSMPGGCAIGYRPVDIHLRGLQELGAKIELKNGYIVASVNGGLKGANIFLGGPFGSSVLATANILMAAVLAKGKTVIESAACEPEITDLANCLVKMGAKISGIGSPQLTIHGVKDLNPVEHTVIPDRIEAGTFLTAAVITKGKLKLKNCRLEHLMAVVDKLRTMNIAVEENADGCEVSSNGHIRATDITTLPYPGFPTDLQAQFMACLCMAKGNSVVTEKIFPDRFMHVAELSRMAANLRKEGPHVIVSGVEKLIAAPVMASDLRASAALVVAALAAHGETIVNRVYHIDRGYERIEKKLNAVGAKIERQSV
ncbi:MAG: UDP-N-acetylglucosamine 1-carboxyvinyltransferase [Planctomycetes bacterium]|nr:UDP-N-acetylglucosamine 1-carboxyvinyltransferase [Planctomycetota bacterium]MBU2596190.1 UDP-N-acetylglucosamine 1-carboxyvinyltransferase [Planctomycetota bacterium]